MFQKKQDQKNITRVLRHTHHAHMYAKVYQYIHCSQKGHLGKFCYDRLNAINKHI